MDYEAEVEGIGVSVGQEGARATAVVLSVREELVPIFVGPSQAQSMAFALEGEPPERPLTHDLLIEMITEFGGAIDRVRIDDLADGTFYAKVDAERYEEGEREAFVFDARPSDGIALALRVDCPILIDEAVIDRAGRPPEELEMRGIDEQRGDDLDSFRDDDPDW
ncbi:MAG: bifunctional nuclease family protein [Halobacteriales archaeon]